MDSHRHYEPEAKPRSYKELAALYEVRVFVIKTWLKSFKKELGQKRGWYFNIRQVKIIFKKLGVPNKVARIEEKRINND